MSFLPSLLSERARDDGERVALSFKEGGAFRFLTWAEVEQEVSNLSRALGRAGLNSRSQLWVSGEVSVRQLLTVLAALSLDARILVGDDTTAGAATWAFVCGSIELRRLLAKSPATSFGGIVFDDRRARPPVGIGALAYSELIAESEERTSPVAEVSPFSSIGAGRRGFTSLQLQHAFVAALPEASRFAGSRSLFEVGWSSQEVALLVLAHWLGARFELGLPEQSASVERDASELGVSLRIASASAWDEWADAVRARLAPEGSRKRRFVDWALATQADRRGQAWFSRVLSRVLVVGPMKRALGLRRWRRAVTVDGTPNAATLRLLTGLAVTHESIVQLRAAGLASHAEEEEAGHDVSARDGELARQSA